MKLRRLSHLTCRYSPDVDVTVLVEQVRRWAQGTDALRGLTRPEPFVGRLRIPRVVGEDRGDAIGGVHRSPTKIWATRRAAA